jgi:hypothetical protein
MKKLLFNNGGQPIYLEDLEALQAQVENLQKTIHRLFLHVARIAQDSKVVMYPAVQGFSFPEEIIYKGDSIPCTSLADHGNPNGCPVRVIIKKINVKMRTLQSGSAAECSYMLRAYIYPVTDENDTSYSFFTEAMSNIVDNIYIANWRDCTVFSPQVADV